MVNPAFEGYPFTALGFNYNSMIVIITDLDGTLLGADYSWRTALPAIAELKRLAMPLVLCTSKTRAEVELICSELNHHDPFIVENGGALYVPEGYFPWDFNTPVHRAGYGVIEFGTPYLELVRSLQRAAQESNCRVRGFYQMSAEEISRCCGLPLKTARLAKQREYDEPFRILQGDPQELMAAIAREKKRCVRGGNFYHILSSNDKAHCVNLLIHYYRTAYEHVITVGLGNGLNDVNFLKLVDLPLVLESPDSGRIMSEIPRARLCRGGGPEAWNKAVLQIVASHSKLERPGAATPSASGADFISDSLQNE